MHRDINNRDLALSGTASGANKWLRRSLNDVAPGARTDRLSIAIDPTNSRANMNLTQRYNSPERSLKRIFLCAQPQQVKIKVEAVFGRIDFMPQR